MKPFTKKHTNPLDWHEFSATIDTLISNIEISGKKISVIAPLLRTGGIIGGILSIKMRIVPMLPVQFKHSIETGDIKQTFSVPDMLERLEDPLNILLCEGNTSTGSTAILAARTIKEKYPQANIYLATLTKVFGCPERLEGIEEIFYGQMTDEQFTATENDKQTFNLREGITIFPWENVEDELKEVNT